MTSVTGRCVRTILAVSTVCAVFAGCAGERTLTVEALRDQASARVLETNSDGVAGLTLDTVRGSIVLLKGTELTQYVALSGDGAINTIDNLYLGAKKVDELPLQQLFDARASAERECKDLGTDDGFATLEVAPAGALLLTRLCPGSSGAHVLGQTLDGHLVPRLGEVDSAEALAKVLAEFIVTHGGKAAAIRIDYGPSPRGQVLPSITVLGDLVGVSGTACRAALSHQTFDLAHVQVAQEGGGLALACERPGAIPVEEAFDVAEVSPERLAAALTQVYQRVPRDSIQHVDILRDSQGIAIVVNPEGAGGTWNLDGTRR